MAYLCGVKNSLWLLIILVCSSGAFATDVPAGNVSGTWTLANSPYLINGNIRLAPNDTLHIEPGVDVIFRASITSVFWEISRRLGLLAIRSVSPHQLTTQGGLE